MRALGYPRSVSMDNFRAPNFQLVADVLYWMVKRYDPDIAVSDNIESENDRVDFLTGVAEAMLNKAHIKLNAKRLYAADGHAVKELLKLATLLYSASRVEQNDTGGGGGEGGGAASSTFADDEAEAPLTSQAVSGSLGSTRESELIESGGREILARSRDNIAAMRRQCEDLEADEAELNAKIKKKRNELDRGEKRLKSLQAHRPAFADELDKLEGELRRYYEVYVDRFRNLDFLEHNLDRFHESEMEELEEYERKRNRNAERVRREQLKQVSLNDSDDTGSLIDEDDESTEDQASRSYSDSNDDNF
ncbi:putative: flagellar associated protein, qilin-like protein [Ectocarpus siliculosus]|uniref:Putative: flagellar associated protein, qilin-like protein n=1 Tax=Ectocarpus siliculosus TaxID=2880 RepID=D8LND8_ECTSI|nr:putative: flagellar associated protein, qilin-like protein [Ectocarpus siliculosus]|eukprot:CBN77295.1 putative: flagellar associated protein, qilin-like protein [Ectocarpus siliculosus]